MREKYKMKDQANSKEEKKQHRYAGVGLILGAGAGFSLGGPVGAGIGAAIGLLLGAGLDNRQR
jgi:hypothetical protein